ncbi:MAG: hypothetical protein ABMA64_11475 [Myxococcota bacterium]
MSVWFGSFPSEEQLLAYLEQDFAVDMDEPGLDLRYVESGWQDEPTAIAAELLDGHSGAPAYREAVEGVWPRSFAANAVVLVFGARVGVPRSVEGPDHVLQFVGTFGPPPLTGEA